MAKYMTEYIDKEKARYLVEKAVSKADAMNALRELKAARGRCPGAAWTVDAH